MEIFYLTGSAKSRLAPQRRSTCLGKETLEKEGKKTDLFGPNPQGQITFDPNGRISMIITRSDLPKFASNNRHAGTPEENKAVVEGSIAYFGTYSAREMTLVPSFYSPV
jgi:hypothetical protein